MAGHEISVSRLVAAPAEDVWVVLTDLANASVTLRGVTGVEVLTDGPYAVGTRWLETRRMFGKEETQELTVTRADQHRGTTVEANHGGVHYSTEFTLTGQGDGTRLGVRFGAEHPDATLLQRVTWHAFGRVGAKITGRLLAQDLADIALRAESQVRPNDETESH